MIVNHLQLAAWIAANQGPATGSHEDKKVLEARAAGIHRVIKLSGNHSSVVAAETEEHKFKVPTKV
jgi:hypothetical protein